MEARAFLKGAWRPDMDEETAVATAIEALVAAAEEDAATGGPDVRRGIFPNVVTVTEGGYREIDEEVVATLAVDVLDGRP